MNFNPEDAYRKVSREQSRERLILENVTFVRKILSTMTVGLPAHVDRDGLESAGVVGLVEAANSYDPTREVPFKTYAYTRIRGAILDELRKTSMVSQQTLQQISVIRSAYETLPPPVTPEMLAEHTGLTLEQVTASLEAMRFLTPQNWNDLYCTLHSSWRDSQDQPEKHLEVEESKQILARSIEQLPEKERLVLSMYFADDLNLAEIGAVLDISESYASRLLASAKFRLKELYRKEVE